MPDDAMGMRKALRGVVLIGAGDVCQKAAFFLANVFIIRSLSGAGYADFSMLMAAAAVFVGFTDLGLNQVTIRDLSRKTAPEALLVYSSYGLRLLLSLVICGVVLAGHAAGLPWLAFRHPWVQTWAILGGGLFSVGLAIFQARGNHLGIFLSKTLVGALFLGLILAALSRRLEPAALVCAYGLAFLAAALPMALKSFWRRRRPSGSTPRC